VALVIQHAKRTHCILLLFVACLAVPYFPHYLINGTIFGKMSMNIECVFWFHLQPLSETFLILRRTEHINIKNVSRSSCYCCQILLKLEFLWNFQNTSNLIKICPVGAELFHADGWTDWQTDMTKLMAAFIIFRVCLKIENCICGQGGIIFFSNTNSEFPFRFIIIINHIEKLLFRFLSSFVNYACLAWTTVL
jgi:hypothetical protein